MVAMTAFERLSNFGQQLLQKMQSVGFLWQLALVLACIGAAYLLDRRWRSFISTRIGKAESKEVRFGRIAARGTERIVFPLSVFLLVLIAQSIAGYYQLDTSFLKIVIPLSLSLAVVRLSIYVLRRSFTPSPAIRTWEGAISLLVWGIVALHLLGWLPGIQAGLDEIGFKIGSARFSLLSVIKLGAVLAIFIAVASWMSRRLEQIAGKSTQMSAGMRVGLVKFTKVILYTVAILISLDSVGIDLTTLAVFGGALGVGLGFGLQRIASNFISGFILLFDRSIKPGDVISIGDRFGWVQALHARYVVVRDRDGVETLIPNENLITSEVINWSYSDRQVRVRVPVQISYDNDPEVALQIMVDAGEAHDRVLSEPGPQARLLGFGDNGINLELRLWVVDPEQGIGSLKSDINLSIWKKFKQEGIVIPFPQRDVRIISTDSAT